MNESTRLPKDGNNEIQRFVKLLLANQRRIYGFIFSLVPDPNEADELLQVTSITLWEKFDQFIPGTDFAAWANKIAHFKILTHLKRRRTASKRFSTVAVEAIAEDYSKLGDEPDQLSDTLNRCLKKLPERHRKLVRLCYEEDSTISSVAQVLERSVSSIYKILNRIRRSLLECIQLEMQREEGESS